MSVGGKVKENKGNFEKETGFGEYNVICVNPDKESLERLLGNELDKDPVYISVDDEGVKKSNIVIWLRNVKDEKKFKSVRFYLKDKIKENKDKTKKQYINTVGVTSWADDESNLPDWFSEREYREAHEGEEELYNFVIAWLNKLDTRDADTTLSFDWSKLITGNVRDISSQIGGEYEGTVVCLSTVKEVEKDGEVKQYEQIYNRKFLPGYTMKFIRLKGDNNEQFIQNAKAAGKKKSWLQSFILEVVDPNYGIKDFYTLNELENYDPSKHIVNNGKVLTNDDTDY